MTYSLIVLFDTIYYSAAIYYVSNNLIFCNTGNSFDEPGSRDVCRTFQIERRQSIGSLSDRTTDGPAPRHTLLKCLNGSQRNPCGQSYARCLVQYVHLLRDWKYTRYIDTRYNVYV